MRELGYDIAHLLDGTILLLSFTLLYQRRLTAVINIYAIQALVLAAAAAWQGYIHHDHQLYLTAGMALVFKAGIVPYAMHRIIVQFGIHRTIGIALGIGPTMIAGASLVALSVMLVLPSTTGSDASTREGLALALSTVLLGLLMMITRRNAVTQVMGFLSLENGLILAAVGVTRMPLLVELSVAFSIMVAFIIFGIFFFRIRERFDSLDIRTIETFRGERR
ncbi:MAG: hydrogenase-4 component E [Alphaproteobacteria bacterium]|nr:hydrogenase-4 component E [Alphaproteobacteria bacterium]